jgi:hypothetical protein
MSPEWPVVPLACAMIGLRSTDTIHITLIFFVFAQPFYTIEVTTMSPELLVGGLMFYWYHAYHIGSFCLPNLLIQSSYTLFNIIHFTIPARTYLSLSFFCSRYCLLYFAVINETVHDSYLFLCSFYKGKKHNLFCHFAALISHSPRQSIFHSMEEQNTMTIIIM